MTINDVIKRARACKHRGKRKWETYELFKQDIQRLAKSPEDYQQGIQQLKTVLKI